VVTSTPLQQRGGGAEAAVATAGRLGHGVVAGRLAQGATCRTARWKPELRSNNVGVGTETAVTTPGSLGLRGVVGRVAPLRPDRIRTAKRAKWSRDEESFLNEEYARLGMCRVCILRCPCAHTCMYVYTMDGAFNTHIDTHKHIQSLTRTCIYTWTHILHVDLLVIYAR